MVEIDELGGRLAVVPIQQPPVVVRAFIQREDPADLGRIAPERLRGLADTVVFKDRHQHDDVIELLERQLRPPGRGRDSNVRVHAL